MKLNLFNTHYIHSFIIQIKNVYQLLEIK